MLKICFSMKKKKYAWYKYLELYASPLELGQPLFLYLGLYDSATILLYFEFCSACLSMHDTGIPVWVLFMKKPFIKVNDSSTMVYTLKLHLQRIAFQTTLNCFLAIACRVPFSEKYCLCMVSLKGECFYQSITWILLRTHT